MMLVTAGSTDVTTYFHLRLAADGTDATGLTITGFDLQYVRSRTAPSAKVDATALAATDSAHGDNQAIEIDATDQPGVYRVDWPDAAFAAGVDEVILTVKVATAFTESLRVRLMSATRGLAGTALPDAAADAAGGLPISDAGGLDLDAQIGTDIDAILTDTAEIGAAGAGLTNINLPNQTMDIVGNITGNLSGSVGSVTGAVGSVTGAVGSVTAGVTLADDAITAAKFDETTAFPLKADDSGSTQVARVGADGDTLETLSDQLDAKASQASVDDLPTNAELATALGTADDATLAAIAALNNLSAAQVNAEVDTALADIHLDHLLAVTYDPASKPGAADALLNELVESDAGVARYTANALEQGPGGGSAPTAADIADAVWEEAIADHSGTAGSTAEALNAAGSAGDPWVTALPGAYGAGSAGKIIGDNLNATVSSRATQTSVDDLPTNAELATALGTADDAVLAAIAALNDLSAADIRTAVGLASANLDTQLGDLPTNSELATALAAADDAVLAAIAALNNLAQADIRTAVGLGSANLDTQLGDLPTNAELTAALASADDAVLAAIAALNNLSAAQVNAEVVDALVTDTYAEPAAVPSATASLKDKINWLATLARNKVTQTSTTQTLRNDADSSDIATAAVSDDTVTAIRGEWT